MSCFASGGISPLIYGLITLMEIHPEVKRKPFTIILYFTVCRATWITSLMNGWTRQYYFCCPILILTCFIWIAQHGCTNSQVYKVREIWPPRWYPSSVAHFSSAVFLFYRSSRKCDMCAIQFSGRGNNHYRLGCRAYVEPRVDITLSVESIETFWSFLFVVSVKVSKEK